ncbi:MAG TPA: DNA-binding response regulator [Ruminococcus sp.]|nr:DNA-binding response regulator [Ruminococcus sp.]
MRILVIEDEVQLADAVSEILKRNKYFVDTVYDGADGLDYALTGVYDCILLDVMLPKMNGFEVLSNLRQEKVSTPVIMLTAKSEVEDKITGLDGGADDYITKPFNTNELLARIRATTRRKGELVDDNCISFENLKLMKNSCSIAYGGNDIKLSLKEFQIMELLISNPHRILPKERIIEKIWGYESDVEYNNIEVYISFLRKKLSTMCSDIQIKTARGIGYSLEKVEK